MREPFVRPFFAKFFYWYAGISTVLGVLLWLVFPGYFGKILGPNLSMLIKAYSGLMVLFAIAQGIATAAFGYVIELLAKIEWNTRPSGLAGQGYTGNASTPPVGAGRLYYYIDKGPLVGPLTAPDLLNLVRDGKLSIATRYFVEEGGQRRPLSNLSEINL